MKKTLAGGRPQTRLSNREFLLLVLLSIALIGYLFGYKLLVPKWTTYQDAKSGNDMREVVVNRLQADFEKKAEYEKELLVLKDSTTMLKDELPAYRAQEELMLLTDRTSMDTSMIINVMTFDVPTILLDGSALPADAAVVSDAAVQATTTAALTSPAESIFLIVDQQVSLSFQGSYASVYAFLQKMEQNVRKVYPKDLTLSGNEEGLLAGSMKLSFLSFVDAANEEKYQFDLQLTPGRTDPFTPYPGYDNGSNTAAPVQTAYTLPDFSMKMNNYLDNAAKVILDAINDPVGSISSDENKSIAAKLVIKGDEMSFTHSLTLGGNSVASVVAKDVKNNVIRVQIISQPRRDSKDLVGLTLDVDNLGTVPVEITIMKDDLQNPRFRVGKTTGTVDVKQ